MKRFAKQAVGAALAISLLVLSFRFLWLASATETGLQTAGIQWRDATLGWFDGRYQPVPARDPPQQAEFWLRETQRVLEAHPNDGGLAMGAALVLDSPGGEYQKRYVKEIRADPAIGNLITMDWEEIGRQEGVFEKKCKKRCLELAAKATQLDPTNVHWWRLRALLLNRQEMSSDDENPRDPDWSDVLAECARYDPDNALYDYLAAWMYWEAGGDMDFPWDNGQGIRRVIVDDAETFQRGTTCFERGQTKPYFAVGDAGFSAVARFLRDTRTPLTDRENIVNTRGIHLRRGYLLIRLSEWQIARANKKALTSDVEAALVLHRQYLHLTDQYTAAGDSTAFDDIANLCKARTTAKMKGIVDEHQDLLSAAAIEEIARLRKAVRLEKKLNQEAAQEMVKAAGQQGPNLWLVGGGWPSATLLIVEVAPALVVLLLTIGFSRCRWHRAGRAVGRRARRAYDYSRGLLRLFWR